MGRAEQIPSPPGLAEYQVGLAPILLDLHELTDDQLPGEPVLRCTLELLKYSRSKQLADRLGEILRTFAEYLPDQLMPDWFLAIEVYVMSVNKSLDSQQYKQTLASVLPTKYEPGSLADRLLTQGREEGREEGREQGMLAGKIQLLEDLLGEPATSTRELLEMSVDSLQIKLSALQQKLRDRPA